MTARTPANVLAGQNPPYQCPVPGDASYKYERIYYYTLYDNSWSPMPGISINERFGSIARHNGSQWGDPAEGSQVVS